MAKTKAVAGKPRPRAAAKQAPPKRVKRTKAAEAPPKRTAVRAVRAPRSSPPAPAAAASPAPPASPAPRDELIAPRDVGRLLRYGERFGPHKIDIRMLPQQLPVASSALALCDPGVPKTWRVLDRPVAAGRFRVMLSVARDGTNEQLAAFVVHVGQPPIAKWTIAQVAGKVTRIEVTTGWLAIVDAGDGSPGPIAVAASTGGLAAVEVPLTDGRSALAVACPNGAYAAHWAVDAADKPVCLVVDFDVFTQKEWRAKPT